MVECWDGDAGNRPTFGEIKQRLHVVKDENAVVVSDIELAQEAKEEEPCSEHHRSVSEELSVDEM